MKKSIIYLLIAFATIIAGSKTFAQGGLSPMTGSTHVYSVTPGNVSNTLSWTVSGGVQNTDYTISGESTSEVEIKWLTAGSYTLQFTENDGTCSTVKEATINVSSNTFDVSTSDPTATCNSASGVANHSTVNATTSVTFTIDMTTGAGAGWNPDWEITFTLTPGAGASIESGSVSESEGTLTESAGTFTLTGISSSSGTGSVTVTMDITGSKTSALSVDLDITSAKELDYNTADVDSDDWAASQTISAIPATSDITSD